MALVRRGVVLGVPSVDSSAPVGGGICRSAESWILKDLQALTDVIRCPRLECGPRREAGGTGLDAHINQVGRLLCECQVFYSPAHMCRQKRCEGLHWRQLESSVRVRRN